METMLTRVSTRVNLEDGMMRVVSRIAIRFAHRASAERLNEGRSAHGDDLAAVCITSNRDCG
ncbi:hypothetical protein [Paraburkholderia sp.]|uniref:hypothetical protein n=1 Tax=Paraburkholderia sp. TaxID=1926495 RepID=UPI002D5B45BA|nr:hypothetical protein [Paraburkholderia sp.]HZZ04200.1 hypothetical protein [Paraburkholderia sp.]